MTGPLNLYLRRGFLPTVDLYDKRGLLNPPSGSVSIGNP